jgi:hypothetical protein
MNRCAPRVRRHGWGHKKGDTQARIHVGDADVAPRRLKPPHKPLRDVNQMVLIVCGYPISGFVVGG